MNPDDFEREPTYRTYSNLNHPQNQSKIQRKEFKYIAPLRFSHEKTKSNKNFPVQFFLNV